MNKKRKKPYKREKAIDKDKYFIAFVIVLILLIINLFTLAYYKNKEKQETIEYQKRQEEKLKSLEAKEKKKRDETKNDTDIIFLGDSLTDYYDLDKYYDIKLINSGVAGWTTDQIIDNLDKLVYAYNPTKVILLIGTNDLNQEKDSDYIVNNIGKIVDEIKQKYPEVKMYIESLYPINNTDNEKINHTAVGIRKNSDIKEINRKLEEYCKKNKYTYINMYDELTDKEGNLNLKYTKEGLHMSDEGYKVVTKKLKKYLL